VRRFLAGFLVGAILLLLTVALVARFGFADVRADAPIPSWFASWFSASVHRSVRRQATVIDSLPPASDAEIIAGGKLYLDDCVGCHGQPGKPRSEFGATFYPPAPQLALDGTSYSEKQIFWIAKHGIRRTGMSAQSGSYSDEKLRLLAAFVSRIKTLPPSVVAALKQKTAPQTEEIAQPGTEPKK
jgi:mono/diheme cytochrome c family protein